MYFFCKPGGHICVVLTFSKVNKETPLQRRAFRIAFLAKIHASGDVLFNIFVWFVFCVRCFCKPGGQICVVLTFSTFNEEDCSIILSGLYFLCVFFFWREAWWATSYGVDRFNSQEGNSSLQKRGAEKYISGKRMQMQTKLFNKYVLVFFFCADLPFSPKVLISHIRTMVRATLSAQVRAPSFSMLVLDDDRHDHVQRRTASADVDKILIGNPMGRETAWVKKTRDQLRTSGDEKPASMLAEHYDLCVQAETLMGLQRWP